MHVERMAKGWGEKKSIGGMVGAGAPHTWAKQTQGKAKLNHVGRQMMKTESAGLSGLRKRQIPEG